MKKLLPPPIMLIAAVGMALFTGCASSRSGSSVVSTRQEMSILDPNSEQVTVAHYSPAEIANWNVLVLDTGNTNRTVAWLNETQQTFTRLRNRGAAADCDIKQLNMWQDARLKHIFKSVSYTKEAGKTYDLVILRDFVITPGSGSGSKTEVYLGYWFVYEVTSNMQFAQGSKYLYRTLYSSTEYATVPYPATSLGIQAANKSSVETLNLLLEGGLDMYTLK